MDIPAIVDLAEKLYSKTVYSEVPFDKGKVNKLIRDGVTGEETQAVIIVSEHQGRIVGVLGCGVGELSFSTEKVATELLFWLEEGYRKSRRPIELIETYLYWAKHVAKVRYAVLSSTPFNNNESGTPNAYLKRGFKRVEQSYLAKV